MDTRAIVAQWIEGFTLGWHAGDSAAITKLFSEDVIFRSQAFRPLSRGRSGVLEYFQWALSSEKAKEIWFGEPVVDGSRASVEYWANLRDVVKKRNVTLAGCVMLRFDSSGMCSELRDYWALESGHRSPLEDWGR